MLFNTTGNNNTAMGFSSLYNNQHGNSNVAIGTHALYSNANRSNLVAIGDSALYNNTLGASAGFHGSENTAIGSKTLFNNTTGYRNTAVGIKALFSSTIGRENTANGWGALYSTTTGSQNTSGGSNVMYNNTTGSSNVAYGWASLNNNTTGNDNTAIGTFALNVNIQGIGNTGLGISANVGSANLSNATAIGANAMAACSNCMVLGSINGVNGATSDVKVGIGTNTPTNQFEVIGAASATPVTLVIGNRGGFGPAALEFVSDYAGPGQWRPGYIRSNDLGGFIGSLEFYTNGSGNGNLYGNVKGFEVRNGFAYTATGAVLSYSDARLKNSITAFTDGLNVISKINPVQFYYNGDAPFNTDKQQVGVIAQDLEKVAPYMIDKNKQNGYDDLRSVNNQAYTFLLINAVKEQQQQIEKQQKQIESSNEEIKQLKQQQKHLENSGEEVKQLQQQVVELKKLVEQLIKK